MSRIDFEEVVRFADSAHALAGDPVAAARLALGMADVEDEDVERVIGRLMNGAGEMSRRALLVPPGEAQPVVFSGMASAFVLGFGIAWKLREGEGE